MTRSKVRSFAKAALIVVAVGALGITDCLQHPLFGKLPRGERLANIAHSPHGLIRLGRIDSGIEALSGGARAEGDD